jgi:hypothetical protein
MKTLPDKPSELIRLAIGDLCKVEKNPIYRINMNVWHSPNYKDMICEVCLAGAVMAGSLDANPSFLTSPLDYCEPSIYCKLQALDKFRRGTFLEGVSYLERAGAISSDERVKLEELLGAKPHERHEENSAQFKSDMLALANFFESHGY